MSEETARMILFGLTTVGAVFWLVTANWFVGVLRGARATEGGSELGFAEADDDGPGQLRSGSVEVKGRPDELAPKLAAELARHGLGGTMVKVLEASHDRVRFEVVGFASPRTGRWGHSTSSAKTGEVVFRNAKGGASLAEVRIDPSGRKGLLLAGSVMLVLGLLALLVGFVSLNTYVVGSARPGVRPQVVQMVQCVHFLWPPWLFGMIYRRENDGIIQALKSRIANLPFV